DLDRRLGGAGRANGGSSAWFRHPGRRGAAAVHPVWTVRRDRDTAGGNLLGHQQEQGRMKIPANGNRSSYPWLRSGRFARWTIILVFPGCPPNRPSPPASGWALLTTKATVDQIRVA